MSGYKIDNNTKNPATPQPHGHKREECVYCTTCCTHGDEDEHGKCKVLAHQPARAAATPQPPQADRGAERWEAVKECEGRWAIFPVGERWDTHVPIATVDYSRDGHEETRVTKSRERARLIATAPSLAASHRELVEALRGILNATSPCEAFVGADGKTYHRIPLGCIAAHCLRCRAVAALAEAEKLAAGGSL